MRKTLWIGSIALILAGLAANVFAVIKLVMLMMLPPADVSSTEGSTGAPTATQFEGAADTVFLGVLCVVFVAGIVLYGACLKRAWSKLRASGDRATQSDWWEACLLSLLPVMFFSGPIIIVGFM